MQSGLRGEDGKKGMDEVELRLGLSQAEFSRRYAVNQRSLQEWEQGRRRPDGARIVGKICRQAAALIPGLETLSTSASAVIRELSACAITRGMNEVKACGKFRWHHRGEKLGLVALQTRRIHEIGKEKRFSLRPPKVGARLSDRRGEQVHLIGGNW